MTAATCPTGKAVLTRELAAEKARRSSKHYSRAMGSYKCPECGQWHIGAHSGGSIKKPMKFVRKH